MSLHPVRLLLENAIQRRRFATKRGQRHEWMDGLLRTIQHGRCSIAGGFIGHALPTVHASGLDARAPCLPQDDGTQCNDDGGQNEP